MVTQRYGHPRPQRLPLLVLGALIALVGPAACSGGSETSGLTTGEIPGASQSYAPPGASVAATPSATASSSPLPSARSAKIAGATLAGTIRAAAARDRTVTTSVLVTGPLGITGDGAAKGTDTLKVAVTLAGEKSIAVVRTGSRVYLKLPTPLVSGKAWTVVPSKQDDPVATMYSTTFEGYETPSDLAATPKALASLGTYTVGGAEQVNGVAATKYTVSTSAVRAARLLPPAYQPVNPTRMKGGRAVVSVWVDASGRLLRTATVATIPSTKRIKVLIGYTGWGKPVDVSAPPAADVGKLS